MTWHFANSKKSALDFVIAKFRFGQPLTVHWEQIETGKGTIHYTEYYTLSNGLRSLASGTRIAK